MFPTPGTPPFRPQWKLIAVIHCVATLLSVIAAYLSVRSLWIISTGVDLAGEPLSLRQNIPAWQSHVVYHVRMPATQNAEIHLEIRYP